MSDTSTSRRRETFSGLWPWPGSIFLFLFAGWLLYMGSIATVTDVKKAFYGLAGVSLLTLLLALRFAFRRRRAAGDGRVERRSRAVATEAPVATREALPPRSNVRPMDPVEATRPAGGEGMRELEAALQRDRAERGAQLVKLEAAVGALAARLERLERALPSGNGGADAELAERVKSLEARATGERPERAELASVAARVGVLEKRASEGPDLSGYLRVQAFNNAISERLLPRMQQMVANATRPAEPAAGAAASPEVPAALADDVAQLKAQIEADGQEIAALKAAIAARPDLPETINAGVRRRLLALETVPERVEAAETKLAEVADGVVGLGTSIAHSEEGWREVLRRLDGLSAKTGAEAPEQPADVAALRAALTTIIEQTRDIRAEQERLSARFDPPTRVSAEPEPEPDRDPS